MRKIIFSVFVLMFSISLFGQTITGIVSNSSTGEPLSYVSIGVIGTRAGTISNIEGDFSLEVMNIPDSSIIRFSSIGYRSESFQIKDLLNNKNKINLISESIQLDEVVVRSGSNVRMIGITKKSKFSGVCGWGGPDLGKGFELGSKFELGSSVVKLSSVHLHLKKQSYESSMLRLHIRNIKKGIPANELLTENIFISVSEEHGWVEFDLSKYNLYYNGEVALTLEWIRADDINKDRLFKMNGSKTATANILFSFNKKKGTLYIKRGAEAKWRRYDNQSPGFYIKINE